MKLLPQAPCRAQRALSVVGLVTRRPEGTQCAIPGELVDEALFIADSSYDGVKECVEEYQSPMKMNASIRGTAAMRLISAALGSRPSRIQPTARRA